MRPLLFLLILALALRGTTLHAQRPERVIITGEDLPSVQKIVQQAVANDALRRQHRLVLACDQILTTERLDDAGTVFKIKTAHLVYREGEESAFAGGADLPAEKGRHHHRDGDTAKAEHRLAAMDLQRLAPRFDYALTGEEPVRGRACYVVAYSPRQGQPAATREEKVINGLHGRFWIDKGTSEILQGEGSLARPVTVALLGAVTRMDFAFHTQTLSNGEAGPADFSTDLVIKAPFHFYRQRQSSRFENWRRRDG